MRDMPAGTPEDPAFEARVLRAFVKGDRLVSLPARERKKQVILRFLIDRILPDERAVDEVELNRRIAAWHPDVAALRRYLVDSGYATRTGMVYRRAVASNDPERTGDPDRTGPPFV
jgi:hypothetical protein